MKFLPLVVKQLLMSGCSFVCLILWLIALCSFSSAQVAECALKGTYVCSGGTILEIFFGEQEDDDTFRYVGVNDEITLDCTILQIGNYDIDSDLIIANFNTQDDCRISGNTSECSCVYQLLFTATNHCVTILGPNGESCTAAPTCPDLFSCGDGSEPVDNPYREPTINGCGPSSFPVTAPSFSFEECCAEHDVCYGTCGSSKLQCDNNFYNCMACSCKESYDSFISENTCLEVACSYYQAVDEFGCGSFENSQSYHCICESNSNATKIQSNTRLQKSKFGYSGQIVAKKTEEFICNAPFQPVCNGDSLTDSIDFEVLMDVFGAILVVILVCIVCCMGSITYKTMSKKIAYEPIADD